MVFDITIRAALAPEFAKTPAGRTAIVKFRDIPHYRFKSRCEVCTARLRWKKAVLMDLVSESGLTRHHYCSSYCFNLGMPNIADYGFDRGSWLEYIVKETKL